MVFWGTSLIEIGLSAIVSYPKLGSILALCGLVRNIRKLRRLSPVIFYSQTAHYGAMQRNGQLRLSRDTYPGRFLFSVSL